MMSNQESLSEQLIDRLGWKQARLLTLLKGGLELQIPTEPDEELQVLMHCSESVEILCSHWGGQTLMIPTTTALKDARAEIIVREREQGALIEALVRKWGLGWSRISQILRKARELG